MRTIRRALTAPLSLSTLSVASVLAVAACGTSAPVAGAAYGASPSASSSSSSSASASASPPMSNGGSLTAANTLLTVQKTSMGDVLATSSGRTVYWYGQDVAGSGKSACTGGCLTAWPAVTGKPHVGSGVKLTGKLGTITRPGGIVQATYDGYPLYTYTGDAATGETSGNDVGGVWHVFTGAKLSASSMTTAATASSKPMASATASTASGW
jgi:predicted lipoprotein with Yx(FWY)xxD motif